MAETECGDQHQRATHVVGDPLARRAAVPSTLNSRSFSQASPMIRAQCRTLLMMIGRIALSSKLPWAARGRDDRVLADHLQADHHHRLLLGRVDLAWHDRGAGLVRRQHRARAGRRGPEASQRMSLAIFISATATPRRPAHARRPSRPVNLAPRTCSARSPTAGRSVRRSSAAISSLKPGGRVQARADGRPARRQLLATALERLARGAGIAQLVRPARPFLSDGQRDGVLADGCGRS